MRPVSDRILAWQCPDAVGRGCRDRRNAFCGWSIEPSYAWRRRRYADCQPNHSTFQLGTFGQSRVVKKLVLVAAPKPEIIPLRTLMVNQAREVSCQRRFPASLICADREPTALCPVNFYAASLS